MGDGLLDELVGAVDERQRLLQVDDVDAVALGEDEALHLRVPAPGLVPEVDAALEELAHRDDGHAVFLLVTASARRAGGRGALGSSRRPVGRCAWCPRRPHRPLRDSRGAGPSGAPRRRRRSAGTRSRPGRPGRTASYALREWRGRTAKPRRAPTLKTWTPRLIPRSLLRGRWRDVARASNLLDAEGHVAPTVFAQMSALAVATGSINLGQGFPDTDGPASLLRDAADAVLGGVNQYPPGPGHPGAAAGGRRAPAAVLRAGPRPRHARCSSPPARPRRSPRRCSR